MTLAFTPGDTFIPASGQVIGEREKELMHEAVERGWLEAELSREEDRRTVAGGTDKLSALGDVRVWILIGLYLSTGIGTNARVPNSRSEIEDQRRCIVGMHGDARSVAAVTGRFAAMAGCGAAHSVKSHRQGRGDRVVMLRGTGSERLRHRARP